MSHTCLSAGPPVNLWVDCLCDTMGISCPFLGGLFETFPGSPIETELSITVPVSLSFSLSLFLHWVPPKSLFHCFISPTFLISGSLQQLPTWPPWAHTLTVIRPPHVSGSAPSRSPQPSPGAHARKGVRPGWTCAGHHHSPRSP